MEINPRFYRGKKSERSRKKRGELEASPKRMEKIKPPGIMVVVWRPHYQNVINASQRMTSHCHGNALKKQRTPSLKKYFNPKRNENTVADRGISSAIHVQIRSIFSMTSPLIQCAVFLHYRTHYFPCKYGLSPRRGREGKLFFRFYRFMRSFVPILAGAVPEICRKIASCFFISAMI